MITNAPLVSRWKVNINWQKNGIELTQSVDLGDRRDTVTIFFDTADTIKYANALKQAVHILETDKPGNITDWSFEHMALDIDMGRGGAILTLNAELGHDHFFWRKEAMIKCVELLLGAVLELQIPKHGTGIMKH